LIRVDRLMSGLECRVGQCSETWWDQLGRAQGKWSGDSMAHNFNWPLLWDHSITGQINDSGDSTLRASTE